MDNKIRESEPISRKEFTPVEAHKVGPIDYRGIALLRGFISDRGKIRARRVTGVTTREQHLTVKAVENAHGIALLPYSSSAH